MDNLLRNKKTVIVCLLIIVIGFVCYLVFKRDVQKDYNYNNDESVSYLKNYEVNEYIPIYVEEADIVIKYLNDFKNSMIGDINYSYSLLNKEYREKKFGSVGKYEEYVNKVLSLSTYSLEVDAYKVIYSDGNKYFDVYDKEGYHYIFKENSIMNYEVYLDNYTVKVS